MDDRKRALELFSKQVSEGLPFAEDFIKGSADIEDNALLARNLSEDALAQQVLKNTGIAIPDKTAPRLKQEDFLNRILKERYPELEPNVQIGNTPGAGEYGKGNITLNKHLVANQPIERTLAVGLHEAGHQYDDQIMGHKGKNLDLKTLRNAKASGLDLKNLDPSQVYEMYAKGHHANIDGLREGSYGLGALKSMLKSGTFKALPVIGTAATAAAALSSPDASAAIADFAIPGGLNNLGPSEEDADIENPQASPELRKQALMRMGNGR